ncbi:MAG: tRNA (adenosine(37)-N6)-threonylcarbamoyltransferase complex transferase subunit TsaD [Clostridia bacterium]|nr:tRNA (adenosine(37)-N6)-threonylcarbamoyltransferase complex transferase subunit TsaD [Clostridia bacterium]
MIILAIESSCDDTAAAIVEMTDDKRRILSSCVNSQIQTHALYGGVVPEIASREHIEHISAVVREAVDRSGIALSRLDAIGVTYSPGLIGSLLVGVSYAKSLAFSLGVPLIPVEHIKGHAAAAYFTSDDLESPFLALVVSGGHTSLYSVKAPTEFEEIGSTRDDAAGEAFDKVGRMIGLPYPGGAAMDRLAAEGYEKYPDEIGKIKFPSPAISDGTLDFSFSGLKTFALNLINTESQKLSVKNGSELPYETRCTIAAGFTRAITGGIVSKLSSAIEATGYKKIVVAGGVAANSHLRTAVKKCAVEHNAKLFIPPISLCGDNGAMIGAQAYYEYKAGVRAGTNLNAFASEDGANDAAKCGKDGIVRTLSEQ